MEDCRGNMIGVCCWCHSAVGDKDNFLKYVRAYGIDLMHCDCYADGGYTLDIDKEHNSEAISDDHAGF